MVASPSRVVRALLVFASIYLATAIAAEAGAQSAKVGAIAGLVGDVEVVREEQRLSATPGIELRQRDVVVTGESAWASIALADGSELAIGGGTTLVLNEYLLSDSGKRKSGVFSLLVGIVRALVNGGDAGFVVDTQAAVASARSTDFIVDAKDGQTAVFVQEGLVVVTGTGPAARQSVALNASEGTDVGRGQAPASPKVWGQERVEAAMNRVMRP